MEILKSQIVEEILKSQIVEEILKGKIAAKFTVEKHWRADFGEFLNGDPNTKAIQISVRRMAGAGWLRGRIDKIIGLFCRILSLL